MLAGDVSGFASLALDDAVLTKLACLAEIMSLNWLAMLASMNLAKIAERANGRESLVILWLETFSRHCIRQVGQFSRG